MAQDCMALFEKEKLSDVASVEQVCYIPLLEVIFATFGFPAVLCHRSYFGGKIPKRFGGRDGAPP